MATISWNHTDTTGVTTVGAIQPETLNFSKDFSKKISAPGELVLTNTTSTLGRPETIRTAYSRISNIYTGTDVDPSYYAQTKSGASVLIQLNDIVTVTNTDNTVIDLPLSCHLVVKVPFHEVITADVLNTLVNRTMGAGYEQGGSSLGERLTAMIRGAVAPKALD